MSTQEEKLKAIADAIREKEGSVEPILAGEFATRIRGISTVPNGLCTISLTADPPEGGTVSGGGLASDGMTVTVKAEAGEGYKLTRWQENEESISENAEYAFPVNRDRKLVAMFGVASRLPKGYTEVEYVKTDSNTILDSGVQVTNLTTRVVIDITPEDTTTSAKYILGLFHQMGNSLTAAMVYLRREASTNKIGYMAGRDTVNASTGVATFYGYGTIERVLANGIRVTVDMDIPQKAIKVEVDTYAIKPDTISYNNVGNLYLSRYATNISTLLSKIHSAQIYVGGELKGDFLPCVNSDGVTGMYNLIDNTFISPSTGTLTPGPTV